MKVNLLISLLEHQAVFVTYRPRVAAQGEPSKPAHLSVRDEQRRYHIRVICQHQHERVRPLAGSPSDLDPQPHLLGG